jgi:hypothetical protein
LHTILNSLGDEGKPACRNCSSRDVACEYADWTFVPESPFTATSRASSLTADGNVSRTTTLPSPSPYQSQDGGALSSRLLSPPLAPTSGSAEVLLLAAGETRSDTRQIAPWTPTHIDIDLIHRATTPSVWIEANLATQGPKTASSALLRFRYQVIPWMDSNNGRSVFGPAVMTLARINKPVSDCILYCMRLRDENIGTLGARSSDLDARQRLLERLLQEAALEADVGRAILALSGIFCTSPSEWATHLAPSVRRCAEEISSSRAPGFVTEPLKTLLRLHLKIGKTPVPG